MTDEDRLQIITFYNENPNLSMSKIAMQLGFGYDQVRRAVGRKVSGRSSIGKYSIKRQRHIKKKRLSEDERFIQAVSNVVFERVKKMLRDEYNLTTRSVIQVVESN